MKTKELGDLGERLACEYLVKKGYKILGRNYRISFGEIDIIAKHRWQLKYLFSKNSSQLLRTIHFVEVKTIIGNNDSFFPEGNVVLRQSQAFGSESSQARRDNFFPEEKVNYKKQKKLRQLAEIWLTKNNFSNNHPYQIDVIGILINQENKKANIHYFQNVVEDV